MKRVIIGIAVLGVLGIACSGLTSGDCADDLRWQNDPVDTTIAVGRDFQARMILTTCGGRRTVADILTWRSEDTTVATVNPTTGLVTAMAPGQTRLIAHGQTVPDLPGTRITVH